MAVGLGRGVTIYFCHVGGASGCRGAEWGRGEAEESLPLNGGAGISGAHLIRSCRTM